MSDPSGQEDPTKFAYYATPTDSILPFEGPGPGLPKLLQSSTVGVLKGGMESGYYMLCKRNKNASLLRNNFSALKELVHFGNTVELTSPVR